MSDIIITRKVGNGSVARPQNSTAAANAVSTVSNPPAHVANAAIGKLIKALVASQSARGLTMLHTDKGTLTLQTNVPLKPGNEVVLQVQSQGPQTRVQILSVDRQPLPLSGVQTALAGLSTPAADSAPRASATTVGAGSIPSTGPDADSAHGRGAVTAGSRHSPPGEGRSPLSVGLVVAARVGSGSDGTLQTVNVRTGGEIVAGKAIAVPQTNTLTLRVLEIAYPENSASGTRSAAVPPSRDGSPAIVARVGEAPPASPGTTATGTPRATTVFVGTTALTLGALNALPVGTGVVLEILDNRPVNSQGAVPASSSAVFWRLATDWQALKQAISLQARMDGPDAAQTVAPRTGPQLASGMLFFMHALSTGNLMSWLGEERAGRLVQLGHQPLLTQLGEEFAHMSRHAADAPGAGWHAFAVPLQHGVHTEQVRLFYRKQRDGGMKDDADSATHFIVEADLSRTGLFQLEGLVRRHHFDLAVHSARALDSVVQSTIRTIFQDALNAGELAGTLRFDEGISKPFHPPGLAAADPTASLIA